MQLNNTYHQYHWQQLLQQVQKLAARLACIGLSPDKLTLLPLDHLIGVFAFLERLKTEQEA